MTKLERRLSLIISILSILLIALSIHCIKLYHTHNLQNFDLFTCQQQNARIKADINYIKDQLEQCECQCTNLP